MRAGGSSQFSVKAFIEPVQEPFEEFVYKPERSLVSSSRNQVSKSVWRSLSKMCNSEGCLAIQGISGLLLEGSWDLVSKVVSRL